MASEGLEAMYEDDFAVSSQIYTNANSKIYQIIQFIAPLKVHLIGC